MKIALGVHWNICMAENLKHSVIKIQFFDTHNHTRGVVQNIPKISVVILPLYSTP